MTRPHRSRAILAAGIVTGMVTMLFGACGGDSESPTAASRGTPSADVTDGQQVQSVLGAPENSFRVVFAWKEGAPDGPGTFVWEQAGGTRRWDFAPQGAAGARIGWFSVESGFGPGGSPDSTRDCLWEAAGEGTARLGCDAVRPNHPGADAITRAFTGVRLAGRYPDRTIAGRTAACYAFRDAPDTFGQICVDSRDGTPLAFSGTGVGRNKAFHVFEAVSTTAARASVALPPGFAPGTLLGPVRRPLEMLSLPPEFTVPP